MILEGKLVLEAPANWLEAFILGWTLVFCTLKARRSGRHVVISKEIY